jgi:hypothetical protein
MKPTKNLPPVEKLGELTNAQLKQLRDQVKAIRKENPKAVDKSYARRVRMWERKTRKGAAKPKAKVAKAKAPKEEPLRRAA